MYLSRILISNFKNIADAELFFSPRINCLSGSNGEGKTNLLDAIYYLSMTKSYFGNSDAFTYKFGETSAALNGVYKNDLGEEEKISIGLKNNLGVLSGDVAKVQEKIIKRNDKTYAKLSEHIGLIPVVMVSPLDTSLINDSGEERRKFLNIILSQVDKDYLLSLQSYNQLLLQRNKLLKMGSVPLDYLDTLDEKMDVHASKIFSKRTSLVVELEKSVKTFYKELSLDKEQISVLYRSQLDNKCLLELFKDNRSRDLALKYTTGGIQRDDLLFCINDHPLRQCGSQGQQKSFIISLKLAQFVIMKFIRARKPILLLDDVFDKLDMQRVEYLINLVSTSDFGQIFISDSNKVRMDLVLKSVHDISKSFRVENGRYTDL